MIALAIRDHESLYVSPMELERGGISYTVDTLEELQRISPQARFDWILGEDHVAELGKWKNLPRILQLARFIVLTRGGGTEPPAAVPADRIAALGDTGTIDLGGGRRLDSHYSPGHAKHHVGLIDSESGDLYVGDAAGVYTPETGDLGPATPPPDFDLETALTSLRKFAALQPTRLLFSHYGPVTPVAEKNTSSPATRSSHDSTRSRS